MAPIKFEDKLKDKLENRSLEPSQDAWNTLADRLDKDDKKNSNSRFWWLGIAASIIGMILVTTQFYKNKTTVEVSPTVVDTKPNIQSEQELNTEPVIANEAVLNSEFEKENINEVNATEVVSVSNKETSKAQKLGLKKKENLQLEEHQDNAIALQNAKLDKDENIQVETLSLEDLKIIEVVDVIKQLQEDDSSVSDREIDSLLKQAQREILKPQIYDETTKTVSADALLQDVEVELEHSFRDKVFEALKSGYGTVKTAVAERRN